MVLTYIRPDADDTDGGWTDEGGATTLFDHIDESSATDSDYIQSSNNPVDDIVKLRLSDPSVSLLQRPVTVRYRYRKKGDPNLTMNLTASLLQGASTIASWQHDDIGSDFVTAEQALTAPQFALISDFNDLFIQFSASTVLPAEDDEEMPIFYPSDNEPPTSNYATFDVRNSHPVLDFDDTTAEAAVWSGLLPTSYGGGGVTVAVGWSATSATTNTIGWTVEFERIGDQQQDVDSDSFASAQTITAVTVPGTSGNVDVTSVNISDGANMDSVAAGEQFRIRVKRDVANDSATGDAELHWVRITEQ